MKIDQLMEELSKIPTYWSGKQCITEMKNSGDRKWREMYWHGWYFQFWCKERLRSFVTIPSPITYRNGRVQFDAFFHGELDFKAHSGKTSPIPLNDMEAMWQSITQFNKIRFIIAFGKPVADVGGNFRKWHKNLIGKTSAYEKERIKRGAKSRPRFKGFELNSIELLEINKESYKKTISFQKGFRNANGKPRNEKLSIKYDDFDFVELVSFDKAKPKIVHSLDEFI